MRISSILSTKFHKKRINPRQVYSSVNRISQIRIFITSSDTVGNSLNMSESSTLDTIDKVKHYIRIKTHNTITLRFLDKSNIKRLICVRPISYIYLELQSLNDYNQNI